MLKDGLLYRRTSDELALFESARSQSGATARIGWDANDIEATVADPQGARRRVRGQPTVSSPSRSVRWMAAPARMSALTVARAGCP